MPIKFVPYFPTTIEGQAVLDNVTRTRRVLRYRDNERVYDRVRRGMPLFEVTRQETVGDATKAADNLLLRGECLTACAYLKENGISVDLVYIDPPFASGADYAKKVYLRRHPHKAHELANAEAELEMDELRAFEEKMYGDIWKKEDYLNWMFENLQAIKSVMSDNASIYVHLDWHIGHYVKVMMDEIFGEDNFVNEIVWKRTSARSDSQTYNHIHDVLYFYGKTETFAWNAQHTQHDEAYQAERYSFTDVDGRKYQLTDMTSPNPRPNMMYVWKGFEPPINGWRFSRETMEKLDAQERVWYPEDKTKRPRLKRYLDESKGRPLDSVWTDIYPVNSQAAERLDYSTQKPEALLERIIKASSNEGMVVADFFGGSGVTAKVAHALGRRFIHADVGVNSLQTARDRLKAAGAAFTLCDIQDGVSLFRNPVQTMDKLKSLITGLKNEDSLDKFWEGALQDAKLGLVPVYLPNLLDHTTKILDIPLMNRILREALPDLPDGVKQVIVFYVDIDDPATLDKFIKDENPTDIKIELRDLKVVLDEVVLNDVANYEVRENGAYEIEITGFVSDRLQQKIDEYNAKKGLSENRKTFDDGDDEETTPRAGKWKPITISDDGLELIELISLDCTADSGEWHADAEIKIDKKSFVIRDGAKTKQFWDGKIQTQQKPLRLKIRNIAGDETTIVL